ncbi:MAG: type II toxin-antitoxin system VapC family toxin, partial [Blastocatellia bacterium]
MAAYFFDSSALVKRYVRESGTSWAMGILRPPANRIYVAHITAVEVAAALSRRARGGSLTSSDATKAIRRLRRAFAGRFLRVAITSSVIDRAVDLT